MVTNGRHWLTPRRRACITYRIWFAITASGIWGLLDSREHVRTSSTPKADEKLFCMYDLSISLTDLLWDIEFESQQFHEPLPPAVHVKVSVDRHYGRPKTRVE